MRDRLLAALGALIILGALVIIWGARSSVDRAVYVSEMGATGEPTAGWFQVGMLCIVAGASLIAWSGRRLRSGPRFLAVWTPAVSLWISSAFFLVSSQVTCTPGCPLPVGASFTWQDFTHTLVAVLAFAAACWAMLQCSFAVGHPALRRFSLTAAISVAVIAGAGGLMSLFRWNATFGSYLEHVATTIGLAWILVLGLVLAFGPEHRRRAAEGTAAPHPDHAEAVSASR